MSKTRIFNLTCTLIALVQLCTIAKSLFDNPASGHHDFSHYYMGGWMASEARWAELYPTPDPNSTVSAGWDSIPTPTYVEMANRQNVELSLTFVQSPMTALLLSPLGLLRYEWAYGVWGSIAVVLLGILAWQATRIHRLCSESETIWEGLLLLAIAFSETGFFSCRTGNISVLMGVLLGTVTLRGLRGGVGSSATAMALGGVTKYTTWVYAPLFLITRRAHILVYAFLIAFGITLLSFIASGPEVFEFYWSRIFPTMAQPHPFRENESLMAMARRVLQQDPLSPAAYNTIRAVGAIVLALILVRVFRVRQHLSSSSPAHWFAACAALLSWYLLFTPIFWAHYLVYYFPLWGWLAYEARQGRARAVAVATIVAMQGYLVLYTTIRYHAPNYACLQVYSALGTLALAWARLGRR